MDNVTHTLIGALLGESAARLAPPAGNGRQAKLRRGLFLAVAIVGSNFPDADLLSTLGADGKLAYLLEHRGHTHTVAGALLISLAMLGGCALWQRWRGLVLPARDRRWLVALALLAPLFHIAMDALNTYGVHPWWPFDNRWYYGDAVFIVEPLFWAAAAPLAFLLRSCTARAFVVLA
ncbi:MAG TPA: metal-dependent hydrolase, partial [Casimicrobiaceae bacterium]|nr:metal-dependent hydrolase [Casimicrobiaceae bacterium]